MDGSEGRVCRGRREVGWTEMDADVMCTRLHRLSASREEFQKGD